MTLSGVKNGKLLYHLTELDNLDSILKHGLASRKKARELQLSFSDIADQEIIEERVILDLEEYIPFHFHPHSAFDTKVQKSYPEKEFIYINILRSKAQKEGYKILPKHPLAKDQIQLLEYAQGIEAIDWKAMKTPGNEDTHIRHVKMAECLTKNTIYAKEFQSIGVSNEETKEMIELKLEEHEITNNPPYVNVQKWF